MNRKESEKENSAKDPRILTDTEYLVMNALWHLPDATGFTSEMMEHFTKPAPAYTTVATFLKILERKGFVVGKKKGMQILYKATQPFEEYRAYFLQRVTRLYFDGDIKAFKKEISAMAKEEKEA